MSVFPGNTHRVPASPRTCREVGIKPGQDGEAAQKMRSMGLPLVSGLPSAPRICPSSLSSMILKLLGVREPETNGDVESQNTFVPITPLDLRAACEPGCAGTKVPELQPEVPREQESPCLLLATGSTPSGSVAHHQPGQCLTSPHPAVQMRKLRHRRTK